MRIYINNRNWVSWPSAMANKFAEENHETIFLDNGSTYEPLLDYYNSCKFEVIRLPNLGNRAAWDAKIVTHLTEPYVVTDPDYDLSMVPSDWDKVLMEGLGQFPQHNKFGLSWDESKVPPENPAYILDEMYKYPEGNPVAWGNVCLPNNWYGYPNDSSFAVHRPRTINGIDGIRKGRPYTGTHLPWHIVLEPSAKLNTRSIIFDEEIYYYFTHCENSSFTWARLWECGMITEYEQRNNIEPRYNPHATKFS